MPPSTLLTLITAWREEATERAARAALLDVVGLIEREVEEKAVQILRRCAAEVEEILREEGP